ncbi:histidine kinase [Nonomuraea sp. NPDC050556]|uniref:histidine kinase n=1 Tax=Nonomuraea sp. NPDC050556 TaxID=3364369 RepID=UPI003798FC76
MREGRSFLAFALICVGVVWDTVDGAFSPAWLSWAALAVAVVLYSLAVLLAFGGDRRRAQWALAGHVAVVAVMSWFYGSGWFYLFPLAAIACGTVLPARRVRPAMIALGAATGLVAWHGGRGIETILALGWGTFSAGVVVALILNMDKVITELRETRQLLAETAVAEERLRFSRDLHDLLGHTLSVIVVKAEAVRRLIPRDPGQAAAQAADIEAVGRQALTEVREAVTGYRSGSLAGELGRARDALDAAGVSLRVRQEGDGLGAQEEALLGWVVREGVTNVIRHSGARSVVITVSGRTVTIHDDGDGLSGDGGGLSGDGGGSGLRGLRERLAQAGGTLHAGPHPDGGFALTATLKAAPEEL